jgi:2'-5' RNA ligase
VEAAAAEVPTFAARLRGVGSFPSAKRGRAIWAGFEDADRIAELAAAIEVALADEFPTETRPFHPHLTVARSDPPLKLPAGYSATGLEADEWEVDHVVLFRSHLGRPAPRYEPLARFPLGAA